MSKRFAAVFAIIATGVSTMSALEVSNLRAGMLSESGVPADETELIISGELNAADFAYILDNLNNLKRLDISAARIVAYDGTSLPYTGVTHSDADRLPDYALTGLTKLSSISLPASLKAIGKGSLSGTGITALTVTPTVTSIGDYAAMRCEQLTSVTVPTTVTSIGTRAFAYCPKLSKVVMNASVTSIPEGLFEACGGLRSLSLEALSACDEIGPWALAECNGLTTLVLPSGCKALEQGAAYGTSGIETLVLPVTMERIGSNAMSAMTSLLSINASQVNSVPELGDNVWSRLNQSEVILVTPNETENDYRAAEQWKEFHIVPVDEWSSSTETVASTIGNNGNIDVAIGDKEISLTCNGGSLGQIAVFNAAGRRIAAAKADVSATFNTSGWTSGVYLIVTDLGVVKVSI